MGVTDGLGEDTNMRPLLTRRASVSHKRAMYSPANEL